MNRLRRAWRRWRNRRPEVMWTAEQERAWRQLRWLVRVRDGALDADVRREFEQFARDVEHDRSHARERRGS